MGYTTPGTNKLSLGVDTSAASLKKDVKKNLAKKSGLGVDPIDHDTSISAAAVKKAINAPTTKPIKRMPWGAIDDRNTPGSTVGPLMPPNTSGSEGKPSEKPWYEQNDENFLKATRGHATNTRQNDDMFGKIQSWNESKLKNISRGAYTSSTSEGSIKKGGTLNPVTTTETFGNITKPGGGTGFIPKGKGSIIKSYSYTPEPEGEMLNPTTKAPIKLETGDYQGYVAPEKTKKQKRQANRKTRQTDRQEKRGKKTMDIALKRQAKQENKQKRKGEGRHEVTANGDIVWTQKGYDAAMAKKNK